MKNKNFATVLIRFFAIFFVNQIFAQEDIGSRCLSVFRVTPFSQQWRSAHDLLGSLNKIYERIPIDEELLMASDAAASLRNIAMGTPSIKTEWHLWEEGLYDTIVEPKSHLILQNYRKPLISVFASDANQGIRELEMANLSESTSEQIAQLQNSLMWRMLTGKQPPQKPGYLFAHVSFSNTEFARHWKIISKKLKYYFPDFEITSPESLHMTVHFIGQWQLQNWQQYLDHATTRPSRSFRTVGQLGLVGKQNSMAAFRLYGFDSNWIDQIENGNKILNKKGLKQPEEYDFDYTPHITLAKLKKNSIMSSSEVNFRMRSLLNFLAQSIQAIPLYFDFKSDTKVELALAGAQRPKEALEYIGIEDFISYYKTEPGPQD